MKGSPAMDPRAQELLVERAVRPLDDKEHWELDQLGAEDDDSFDLAAAGVAIAMTPIEPMPEQLADKIFAASGAQSAFEAMRTVPGTSLLPGQGWRGTDSLRSPGQMRTIPGVAPHVPPQLQPPRPVERAMPAPVTDIERARERKRSKLAVAAPWIAAAACLMLAIGAWWWSTRREVPVEVATNPSVERQQLLASATDVSKIEWTATKDPTATGAAGDVVWSQREQRGYMRFVGLTPNDRAQFQYQLWIFDKNRDEAFPVDGGVFDVSSTGEVIVPITAKLPVTDATLFAVTIERPGGVVVSKRERIVVTAARKS